MSTFLWSAVALTLAAAPPVTTTTMWGTLPWDGEGRAVLPFWTHRLTLTHKGDAVEVAYTREGDGRGWIDPPNPEAPAVALTGAP